jgi:DMSO/TMAO reductase YedYZ molybdopterin-dependent catalytic subunit
MKRRKGISRRKFIQLAAMGGGTAFLAPYLSRPLRAENEEPWVKDTDPFIERPPNLETRVELLRNSFITPNRLFFVRNNAPETPRIDADDYRLIVEGDGLNEEIELTLEDVYRLPSRTLLTQMECAGNWRGFYDIVQDRPAQGGQWTAGAIGSAYWTGTPLKEVLELAGVSDEAVSVQLIGLDEDTPEGGFRRPMSIEKALDEDTLLAYTMNGETLPFDHGYPLRAVVPGWVGSNSIKWLGRIVVSTEKIWSRNNTTSYVLANGEEWEPPEDAPEEALGWPVYHTSLKSFLALPWPAELSSGHQVIRGFASPGAHDWDELPEPVVKPPRRIARVEWRVDDGNWQEARLIEPVMAGVWARFEIDWEAESGSHTISTRATDEDGLTQPDEAPWNEQGYLMNQVLPHPVEVS